LFRAGVYFEKMIYGNALIPKETNYRSVQRCIRQPIDA